LIPKIFRRKNPAAFWSILLGMYESLPYFIGQKTTKNLWGKRAKTHTRGKPVEILGIDCKKAVESI